jgi:iron complex transport system substrate-binding protein
LSKLGLKVEQIYPKKLNDLPLSITRIGNLIGKSAEADVLARSIELSIRAMRSQTAGAKRPKVYLEIYRDPLMSVSDSSFVGEVIETAGGDNIFSVLERDYARVDPEDVVAARPDIIICYSQDTLANILARKGWQDLPAIRNKRVYFEKDIDPDWILRATPRTILGLQKLRELFQPSGQETASPDR